LSLCGDDITSGFLFVCIIVGITLSLQELSNSQELLTIKDQQCRKLETTLQENIKQLSEKEVG
jgi:hypothetical protein